MSLAIKSAEFALGAKLISQVAPTSSYFLFKCFEGQGNVLGNSSGSGGDASINGTTANLWDNLGWATLNAVDINAIIGSDAEIDSIMNLSTATEGMQLLVAFDYFFSGNISASSNFFFWGENTAMSGWALSINTAEQLEFYVRGVGSANGVSTAFNSSIAGYANQRNTIVLDLRFLSGETCDATVYINSALPLITRTGINLNGSGTGMPNDAAARGLVLFSRRAWVTTYDRFIPGRMANVFGMRRDSYDPTLAGLLCASMFDQRGVLPWVLDGK